MWVPAGRSRVLVLPDPGNHVTRLNVDIAH
jgi:hypothetical protein